MPPAGSAGLTLKERSERKAWMTAKVVRLKGEGLQVKVIAERLGVAASTVSKLLMEAKAAARDQKAAPARA